MKSKLFQTGTIILLLSIVIACGKKDDKPNGSKSNASAITSDALESISIGSEKLFLNYKFKKGEKFRYKLTTLSETDESIHTDSVMRSNSSQTLSYIFDCEVLEIDQETIAELLVKVSSIKLDANINGTKVTYYSHADYSPEERLRYVEYETVYNIPFRARVNQKGEVVEVSRLEKMADKLNSFQPQKQDLTSEQRADLIKNLSSAVLPLTQMIFRELPSKPIAKDSTWEKIYPGNIGSFSLENTAKYRVVDFIKIGDERAAKISADLTVKYSGKGQGIENGIHYNFAEPKISGGGVIFFNIDSGKLVKAETGTNVEVSVKLEGKDSMQKMRRTTRNDMTKSKNIVELL